jgi:hypothetical protein
METLLNIALNVNSKKRSSKNAFLNKDLQTVIENLSLQEKLALLSTANKARLII